MAAKKKAPKNKTRSRKAAGKKSTPGRKRVKKTAIRRKPSARKSTRKKAAVKKPVARKVSRAKKASSPKRVSTKRSQGAEAGEMLLGQRRARSAGQSGNLQGLSDSARADSESVDELLEEGNAFEADVVAGVEAADNADEEEVHTHEVPEDDVPREYLDED
jgi:hypothetical protein